MDIQTRILKRIQHLRHGAPITIRCDKEYKNAKIKAFCTETRTELISVIAKDHRANGFIKNENRTLRSFYDRIRCGDKRSKGEAITVKEVHGNNIYLG